MAYRGFTIPLPVGLSGFSGSRNPSRLLPSQLGFVEGVDIEGDILIRDRGASKLNGVSLGGGVIGGINWSPVAGERYDVVVTDSGVIKRDNGTGTFATTMASGLSFVSEIPPFFMTAGGESVGATRKLFLFSTNNQVKFASGNAATMNNITTPAADWSSSFPIFGVQHANRLWAGGNASDPHRIYYSTLTSHVDFAGAGSGTLAVFPGEGDGLVGGISFRGVLLLWKYPTGIYLVDTRPVNVAEWSVNRVTAAVGGVNANTIFQIGNDIIYLDHGGNIHLMSATQELGDVNTSNISRAADLGPFMRANINLSKIRKAQGAWFASKQKAWFVLPQSGSLNNNLRLMADFNSQQGGPRFFVSRRDIVQSVWMRPDSDQLVKPVIGDDLGFVWLMDRDTLNKGGDPYQFKFITANTDFAFYDIGLAHLAKSTAFLEITADVETTAELLVKVFWDDVQTDQVTFSLQPSGVGLDEFTLDEDALATSGTRSIRQRIAGSGKRLKLSVENSELNQEIALTGFYVSFVPTDERTT